MPDDPSIKHSEFAQTVLGVLFSLTFSEALENTLSGISGFPTVADGYRAFLARPGVWLLRLAQLFAFLLTLSRFYLGSYRFLTAELPRKARVGVWDVIWNVINVAVLFIGFYVAALTVVRPGMFLLIVATIHALDLIWFGVGGPILTRTTATARIREYFIAFDVATLGAAGVVGLWFVVDPFNPYWIQFWTIVLLIAMFAVDVLWLCRDFYFDPPRWIATSEGCHSNAT